MSRPRRAANSPERNVILLGDVLDQLRLIADSSIDVVMTSPPYFLLRDYGVTGQIGLEPDVHDYVAAILAVADELIRVLKPTGSIWLNLGDSFSRHDRQGAPPKSLLMAPERIVLGLIDRGLRVRAKAIWAKPNGMPTSVRDRLATTWEPIYHLTKARSYFFDLDNIRVPHASSRQGLTAPTRTAKSGVGQDRPPAKYDSATRPQWAGPLAGRNDGLARLRQLGRAGHPLGKNPGDVWTIPTGGYRGAHFATFPERLVERPLRATCPARTCTTCGTPWLQAAGEPTRPTCSCPGGSWRPGLVLDPFMGAGTTALVARRLGRDWLGIELNPTYRALALDRIATVARSSIGQHHGSDAPTQGASNGPINTDLDVAA